MKPEKQNLIRDLLEDGSRNEDALLAGVRALQRRRHWRAARHGAALVALALVITGIWVRRDNPRPSPMLVSNAAPKPKTQVRELTDDELLALFPNTPVGLASLPDGKKRLIFPRPGDQAKFITKL